MGLQKQLGVSVQGVSASLETRGWPVGKRWSKATDSSVEGRMDKKKDCLCKADGWVPTRG